MIFLSLFFIQCQVRDGMKTGKESFLSTNSIPLVAATDDTPQYLFSCYQFLKCLIFLPYHQPRIHYRDTYVITLLKCETSGITRFIFKIIHHGTVFLVLFSLLTGKMFASFLFKPFFSLPDIFKEKKKGKERHNFMFVRNARLRYYPQGKCQNVYLRQIAGIAVNLRSDFSLLLGANEKTGLLGVPFCTLLIKTGC